MYRQESGWEPSTSVNPYSRASRPESTDCWFHRLRPSSDASATTARPTYRGDSETAKPGGADGPPPADGPSASRQFSSDTPNASSIISERNHPGVTAIAVAPYGPSSCPCENASRFTATLARS